MALKEKLEVIVNADASGFVRGMEAAGKAADKNLTAADRKLDQVAGKLTSTGAVMVSAGAVAAVGVHKLATAASDYGEAVNKAVVIAGAEGAKAMEEFGAAAADSAGISKTAAVDAAAGFAALGKQAGVTGPELASFSTDLVQLAGDLASFNNLPVDEALQALKSGLQGETEPLKRFNIFLNDTALKAEYFALTGEKVTGVLSSQQRVLAANSLIFKQSADAQGDFARTGDSLANQQRKLAAEFENLKTSVGAGALPVVSALAGAAGNAAEAFGSLSPEAQKTVGSVGALATVGVTVAGGLAFAAGQAIKARNAFTTLGADGTRSLNNVGKAAAGLGGVLTALAVTDIVGQVGNSVGGYAQRAEDDLTRLQIALKGAADAEIVDRFANSVASTQSEWLGLGEIVSSVGRELKIGSTGVQADIENVDVAFQRLLDGPDGRTAASGLVDAMKTVLGTLDPASREYKDTSDAIGRFEEKLGLANDAAAAGVGPQQDLADATSATGEATEEAATYLERFESVLGGVELALVRTALGYDVADAASKGWMTGMERSSGLMNDALDAAQGVGSALKEFDENGKNLPKTLDLAAAAAGNYSDEQNAALDSLQGVGEAVQSQIAGMLAAGASYDQVRMYSASYEQQLRAELEQLGITGEAQEQYIELLGLTPAQVDTAIMLSGAEQARAQLEFLQGDFESLPEEAQSQIYAKVAQNDWPGALALYNELKDKEVAISGDNKDFMTKLNAASNARPAPVKVPIEADDSGFWGKLSGIFRGAQAAASANPVRQQVLPGIPNASDIDRNPYTPFAAGGFLPSSAQIHPAAGRGLVQWAEASTGGEAFIPLAASKRERSMEIWLETGRRLGAISFADGGFLAARSFADGGWTSDNDWGRAAEAMGNYRDIVFNSLGRDQQIAMLQGELNSLAAYSDEWTRKVRDIWALQAQAAQEAADEQKRAQESAAAAAQERADVEWKWNYDHASEIEKLRLAAGRRDSAELFTREWDQWAREAERLQRQLEDAAMVGSGSARSNASGGRSSGSAPFHLTVQVNAEGLVTDPSEVGRQVVGAIKAYEDQNGNQWRNN